MVGEREKARAHTLKSSSATLEHTSNKIKTLLQGNQCDRVSSNTHSLGLDKERDFGRVGSSDIDALDLHAAVHVECLTLEERGDLCTDQQALTEIDDSQGGVKDIDGRV
jgi:hypothetical protein